METKVVDSRGRILLDATAAGRTVIVTKTEIGWIITPAIVIAEHEVWLLKNSTARNMLEQGIAEASAGNFTDSPLD